MVPSQSEVARSNLGDCRTMSYSPMWLRYRRVHTGTGDYQEWDLRARHLQWRSLAAGVKVR